MNQYGEMIESVKADFTPDPNNDEVLSSDPYLSIVKYINENQSSINTGPIKMKKHRSKKWRNGRKK